MEPAGRRSCGYGTPGQRHRPSLARAHTRAMRVETQPESHLLRALVRSREETHCGLARLPIRLRGTLSARLASAHLPARTCCKTLPGDSDHSARLCSRAHMAAKPPDTWPLPRAHERACAYWCRNSRPLSFLGIARKPGQDIPRARVVSELSIRGLASEAPGVPAERRRCFVERALSWQAAGVPWRRRRHNEKPNRSHRPARPG